MRNSVQTKDYWLLIEDIGLLVKKGIDKNPVLIRKLRKDKNFAAMYSLMEGYLRHPYFFNSKDTAGANIFTNTNEIIGIDLKGVVYKPNTRIIVHTHGLYINSKNNHSQSIEHNVLSEEEFTDLLKGKTTPCTEFHEPVPVYKEEDLKYMREKERASPGISVIPVIPQKNYLGDPTQYCQELNLIRDIKGFEANGLLLSRTWRKPEELMNFIKYDVPDFYQADPFIESSWLTCVEKLLEKYAYRVMPLILRDGAILKKADDKVALFSEKEPQNEKYYLAMRTNLKRE